MSRDTITVDARASSPSRRRRTCGEAVDVRRPSIRCERYMFIFFSNRLGCLGSILVSLAITAVLIVLLSR